MPKSLQMKVNKLENKIEEYSERLIKMETRMDEKFTSFERYISSIDQNVGEIRNLIKELEQWKLQVHDNSKMLKDLTPIIDSNTKRLNSVERTMIKWSAVITTIVSIITFIVNKFL